MLCKILQCCRVCVSATRAMRHVIGDGTVKEPAFMKPRYFVLDSADDIMEVLREGWHLEVLCRTKAFLRSSYWYGEWVILFISPEGNREAPLLRVRSKGGADDMRLFKTVNGVFSFLTQNGVPAPHIPSLAGERRRQEIVLEER